MDGFIVRSEVRSTNRCDEICSLFHMCAWCTEQRLRVEILKQQGLCVGVRPRLLSFARDQVVFLMQRLVNDERRVLHLES